MSVILLDWEKSGGKIDYSIAKRSVQFYTWSFEYKLKKSYVRLLNFAWNNFFEKNMCYKVATHYNAWVIIY